jgi:predicted permease
MRNDLRLGLRLLWKDRAFSLTAFLTLAICIGANTALFSVVRNVLLRPLPVPESERILLLSNSYPNAGAGDIGYSGVPDYYDRLRETDVFAEQAMFSTRGRTLDQGGIPTRLQLMQVTPSFFRVVGVPASLGRTFTEEEGELGKEKKAVLSYALWQSQFGGDAQVVGKDVRIDGQPYAVVGVMPRDFVFVEPDISLWMPLAFTAEQKSDAWRLKPGATIERAQAQIDALNAANLDRFPQYKELLINAGFHTVVTPLRDYLVRDVRAALYLMWGGALFVLLIGCVNVANLVLIRSRARLKELATRMALGAARWQVARQLVVESVMLTMASAAAGLLIGYAALRTMGTLGLQALPRGHEIHIDGGVILYSAGIAVVAGLLLGLLPVASVLPADLAVLLREEGRTGTSGRRARALRRALVVSQVAFAYLLLVGAGLLFASFQRVLSVERGFTAEGVLTASVSLPRSRYAEDDALRSFTGEALRRLRALPGVSSAGATDSIPLGGSHSDSVILAEGYQMKPGESVISPTQIVATPGYFETLGVRLLAGRFFEDRDDAKGTPVVIVDEKLARRFWPGQEAVGRRMFMPTDINNLLAVSDKTVFLTVVGVIKDLKQSSLAEGSDTVGTYFFPMTQSTSRFMTFAIRTDGDPASLSGAVRGVIAGLDRELPVFDMQTMESLTQRSLLGRRVPVLLSLTFAAVALFLSAIGIYGVLAYLVTQRTREFAIRIALGSSAGAIVQLVLHEGLWLVGGGFLLGGLGAVALRRSLESQLFGVSATNPLVLMAVASALALVAVLACALPARRATRINPTLALGE